MIGDFSECFTWPLQDTEVKQALDKAYNDGDWGRYAGSNCSNLQKQLCDYFSVEHTRLCSSGTVAVEIALRAAGVKPGDEVILAAYDFPGNFRCIEAVGAMPVLVDVDPKTWSISGANLESAFTAKTKAIIVSHLHGGIAPIKQIVDLAHQNDIVVIEDICQCPGAMIDCQTIPSEQKPPAANGSQEAEESNNSLASENILCGQKLGTFGDIATLSFGGSKLLSAGRGGAVMTNNETMHQRSTIFCDRGNDTFPLSELQAAVLIPQLRKLDERNQKRFSSAKTLFEKFSQVNAVHQDTAKWNHVHSLAPQLDYAPAFYKIPIAISSEVPNQKQMIIDTLQSSGIKIDHGFRGFTKRSKRRCRLNGTCENAAKLAEQTMVLHHPCLLSDAFSDIVDTITEAILIGS